MPGPTVTGWGYASTAPELGGVEDENAVAAGGWKPVLPGASYPDLLLEWAPTTQPTDATQVWVDISSRLRGWDWGYGRNDELGRFEAGDGSVLLDNRDRYFDPSFNAGPWYGNIKPRRMFRLRSRWSNVVYPIFVAYSRGFPQTYPASGHDSVVKVDVIGAEAILQSFDLVAGFTRPEELSGARITAVLDAVGFPAALRDLDAGTVTVAALTVTSEGTSGLDHCKDVAASEFGQLFAAKDGRMTFHARHRRLSVASAHTFTDSPGAPKRYAPGFEPAWGETYLWNYIRVTGPDADDPVGLHQNTASQDDYHKIVRSVSTQLEYTLDRQSLAEYQIIQYAQPQLRAPSLPLLGASSPAAMWPAILDLEVSDRITVTRYATSADPMTLVQNVEGIRHSCVPGGPWTTSVTSSPADTSNYWKVEDATYGQIDQPTILIAP